MVVNKKFQTPLDKVAKLLEKDKIVDPWEATKDKRADYIPVIGILTQPVGESMKKGGAKGKDYILTVNDNFIKWPGSKTIAIPFDISPSDLEIVLNQINGAYFTGGSLALAEDYSKPSKMHKYYKTAKNIVNYSKE